MSLYSELKRRNVFRVAIAYLAASWLLIEVAETIFPLFGFGDTPARIVVTLLAIGFPLFLVFSWAFEITPEGLKLEKDVKREESITPQTGKKLDRVIIVLLALALGYFAFDKFILDPVEDVEIAQRSHLEGRADAVIEAYGDKSIAVLPFDNRSAREDDAYFTDGMHDEILSRLAGIGALRVISRTSVMPYRDTDKSLPEIARELAVTTVLEGAVQRAGDQVRITVQLIDAPADKHLWAETYDRELTTDSLFAIQSEVTSRIAESLKAQLTPSENSRLHDHPTNSLAAYNHYMRGRLLMPSRVTEDLRQAVTEFEQALAADPEYAQAWVQLAICADLLKYQGHAIPRYSNILEEAAHKVLALNDQLGEGYLLLAFTYDWNQADETKMAEAAFQRAVELSPNNAGILKEYAQFLDRAGRWGTDWKLLERSLDLMLRAAELDPLSPVIQILVGSSYLELGREDEGIEIIEGVIHLDPDIAWTYYTIGLHYSWSGRLAEALGWFRQAEQRDAENIFMIYPQANVFRMIGDYKITAEYRDHIAERFPGRDTSWLNLAIDLDGSSWQEALQSDDSATAPLINTWLYLIGEDYQSAYESFLKWRPYWGDPEQWPHLIRTDDMYHGACFAAGIFISAGQEGGWELLALAREYLEVNYAKTEKKWFPWFWNLGLCYLLDGSHEDALDFWEEYVARGHWSFPVWFLVHRLPWWEPLREHPRYIELMNRVEQSKSEQRKLIRKMGVMIPEIPMEID